MTVPAVEPEARPRGVYARQNVAVLIAQALAWAALLTVVDSPLPWPVRAVAVALFCLLMQGVFTLMHEGFHRNLHPDKRVNDLLCQAGATLFGTSATLHRVHHWGHHLRNRDVSEQGEFIHPGESPAKKVVLYYVAILGGLWVAGLVFSVLVLFIPYRVGTLLTRTRKFNTYAAAFGMFKPADWRQMRVETLGALAVWAAVLWATHWSFATLALCYGAFAFTWSSLQWVYHINTPLDNVEGAYNLRLPTPVRWLFLNFNYNLTHHRDPHRPWQELYATSDQRETQPLVYRWVRMFKPPAPRPDDLSYLEKRYF